VLRSYALIRTIYGIHALPDPLLVVLFVVSVIAVSAENLDVSSREFPLFCSVLCLHSSMFSYPCVKMVEFDHPSFFFSMVLKSIRLVASILVADVTEKSHFLTSYQLSETIVNLGSQINSKLNLSIDLSWQSS